MLYTLKVVISTKLTSLYHYKKPLQNQVKDYGDAFEDIENTSLSPKFVYQGETVSKMAYLDKTGETTLLSMSKNGSLAWFKEGIKVPITLYRNWGVQQPAMPASIL